MKPKIKVIERKQDFFSDDMESIDKGEGDWGELEVMNDLTINLPEIDPPEDKIGCVICWNEKEKIIEVLKYD